MGSAGVPCSASAGAMFTTERTMLTGGAVDGFRNQTRMPASNAPTATSPMDANKRRDPLDAATGRPSGITPVVETTLDVDVERARSSEIHFSSRARSAAL